MRFWIASLFRAPAFLTLNHVAPTALLFHVAPTALLFHVAQGPFTGSYTYFHIILLFRVDFHENWYVLQTNYGKSFLLQEFFEKTTFSLRKQRSNTKIMGSLCTVHF